MTTQYVVTLDWPALHEAFTKLDFARTMPTARIGYVGGGADALGGSYFAPSYESDGLAGAVRLLAGLKTITEAAWHIIHSAAENPIRYTPTLVRSAVAVMLAARPAYDLLAAANLCRQEAQSITRGNDGRYLHVTGLHWFAGYPKDRRVTVAQAEAIVTGAEYRAVLSENDEEHPQDPPWM